ncbi:MAG: cyclic nucleotide-binding domain-containing protein, partial [Chitinophagales bacterium]
SKVNDLKNSSLIKELLDHENKKELLKSRDLQKLAKTVEYIEILPNSTLFKQGETGTSASILTKGKLYGTIDYEDLDAPLSFSIAEGDLVGEISLVTGLKRNATIQTKGEGVEILEFSLENFAVFLSLHPDLPCVLAMVVNHRYETNKTQYQDLQSISAKEVEKKFRHKNVLKRFLDMLINPK